MFAKNILVFLNHGTAQNTAISPRFARNYAETVPFHKISTPEN